MASQSKKRVGRLRFSADSQLLFQLGEQLVARRSIALAELVKNAYDADATKVKVSFEDVTEPGGTIIVEDNGEGMSFEVLERAWMRIATIEKERTPVSHRFRRTLTGAKGIGRFACRRIANQLRIESTALVRRGPKAKERLEVVFDWAKFVAGTDVTSVPIVYRRAPAPSGARTGLRLVLEDTRDAWDADDLEELQRDLVGLQPPFPVARVGGDTKLRGRQRDPGFRISISAPELGEEGIIAGRVRKAAWGRLDGAVDERGRAQYRYKIRGQRAVSWSPDQKFPEVGPFKFRIYHFVYDSAHLRGTGQRVGEMRDLGREHGGVRVYMDGFRVFPYGEPADDWLGLDRIYARRPTTTPDYLSNVAQDIEEPLLHLPPNRQVFGAVSLSRARNVGLRQKASREGFLDHPALDDLRKAVRRGLEWMTVPYSQQEMRREAEAEAAGAAPATEDAIKRIRGAREAIAELEEDLPAEVRVEVRQALDMAEAGLVRHREVQIGELALLRTLASTGVMISVLEHETGAAIGGLHRVEAKLEELEGGLTKRHVRRVQAAREELGLVLDYMKQQRRLVGLLVGKRGRERRYPVALRPLVQQLKTTFRAYLKARSIDLDSAVPAALRLPAMFTCEAQSILVNLLTNSLKAVTEVERRGIRVEASRNSANVEILFLDTGPGVPEELREDVFRPFVSYSKVGPDLDLGTGTGLGLKIVRDLVDVYGGSAAFIDPPEGWGACVRILLPKG